MSENKIEIKFGIGHAYILTLTHHRDTKQSWVALKPGFGNDIRTSTGIIATFTEWLDIFNRISSEHIVTGNRFTISQESSKITVAACPRYQETNPYIFEKLKFTQQKIAGRQLWKVQFDVTMNVYQKLKVRMLAVERYDEMVRRVDDITVDPVLRTNFVEIYSDPVMEKGNKTFRIRIIHNSDDELDGFITIESQEEGRFDTRRWLRIAYENFNEMEKFDADSIKKSPHHGKLYLHDRYHNRLQVSINVIQRDESNRQSTSTDPSRQLFIGHYTHDLYDDISITFYPDEWDALLSVTRFFVAFYLPVIRKMYRTGMDEGGNMPWDRIPLREELRAQIERERVRNIAIPDGDDSDDEVDLADLIE